MLNDTANTTAFFLGLFLRHIPGIVLEKRGRIGKEQGRVKAFSWKKELGTIKIRKRVIFVP